MNLKILLKQECRLRKKFISTHSCIHIHHKWSGDTCVEPVCYTEKEIAISYIKLANYLM